MVEFDESKNSRYELQALTFSLDGVSYGVDVHQIREVKNFEGVTPMPFSPAYMKGVTNLRGEIIPVVDLRQRFKTTGKATSEDSGIMVIVQDKHPIGVMVDSVMEVLTISKKDIETNAQSLSTAQSDAVIGVAKHDKKLIIILDLLKAVSDQKIERGFSIEARGRD
jgi:purine-binding chemotaxis protein CheW